MTRNLVRFSLVTMFLWGGSAHALPPDSDRDPPECVADITGRLTATPSEIDRETSHSLTTTLVWSVVIPKGCPASPILTLAGRAVERSGQMTLGVSRTTVYSLVLGSSASGLRTLARATVTVHGDPGFITVSPGRQVTADDIAKFNAQWMQPYQHDFWIGWAGGLLAARDPDGVWGTGERMAAMARMFDLTQDKRYLDHLRELSQLALKYRDDLPLDKNRPDLIRLTDQIRNKVGVPGWGGRSVSYGGLHHVEEIVTSVYAYPIAAFARIVAENPSLQPVYGNDAIDYANAVVQTVSFFLPQIRIQPAGSFIEATLTHPEEYRNRPTEADCTNAYDEAMRADPGNKARWDQKKSDCNNLRKLAGRGLPHNINLTFSMVLIELSRVLDTRFYLQSPRRSGDAENTRDSILVLISRQQRYFANRLYRYNSFCKSPCWNYMDDLPTGLNPHPEDTDHGAMDMSYVGLFFRNFGRLHAAAERFHEPLAFTPSYLGDFARTFVMNIAGGSDFKHDVIGRDGQPTDNTRCEGWLELTRADARVWQACHDVTLRIVDGRQPYLTTGNHSSLLMNKQFLPLP